MITEQDPVCGLKLCMYMDGWGVSHSLYGTVFKEYIYFLLHTLNLMIYSVSGNYSSHLKFQ